MSSHEPSPMAPLGVPSTSASAEEKGKGADIVGHIVGHRLAQDDIVAILEGLKSDKRDKFIAELGDTLRKTSALLEVSRQVSDSISLDILLPRMVEIITSLLDADRSTIFLYDRETGDLYSRVAIGENLSEIRFPSDKGIAGSVFTDEKPVIIDNAYADDRFNPEVDKKTGYRTRTILCAPMRTGNGKVIGCTQVLNKNEGTFDDNDLELLTAVTSQAASAFVNAQLVEQIERARNEEAKLLEVTTAISTELHLEPLLRKIMDTVTAILDADRSTLFMYDPKADQLWSRVGQGLGTEIRIPSGAGIAGSVFTSGKTVNIPDAYADDRFNPEVDKKTGYRTQSILCMPVVNKNGDIIGVTQVLNKRGGPFTSSDEQRLRAFSSQASVAIENARLFEDVITMRNYNESILQSMSNGVITIDADGTIGKVNEAALKLLRISEHEEAIVGKAARDFFSNENDWVYHSIQKVTEKGGSDVAMDVELAMPPESGHGGDKASVNLSVVQLTDTNNAHIGCMVITEDITKEKRLRGTMARYMTKELADKLLEEGESALGGQEKKASVLFSDIRSFTTISEELGAQETVAMLNEYFSIMVDVILENNGILDKYIGDAMMAVFGAPFSGPRDADNAVKAGIGMLKACARFNAEREKEGKAPIDMGIGINTDHVVAGNIGSLKRMDYTVIGDGVNLASRLEGANKPYGTKLLVSELTVAALKDQYLIREVDRIRVKGKSEPVGVYEVMDYHNERTFPNRDDLIYLYECGLDYYRRRDWNTANHIFAEALLINPSDLVSQLYRKRCEIFSKDPPSDDWDGVWEMKTK